MAMASIGSKMGMSMKEPSKKENQLVKESIKAKHSSSTLSLKAVPSQVPPLCNFPMGINTTATQKTVFSMEKASTLIEMVRSTVGTFIVVRCGVNAKSITLQGRFNPTRVR